MSGADPVRSGAIFRVADVSILRQSPAPRLLHQGPPAFATPAPPAFVQRRAPLQPALPSATGDSLIQLLARNVEALSAPIKRERSPSPPRDPPPPPEPVIPKVRAYICMSASHMVGRGPLAAFSTDATRWLS